jgi:tetratricopeptide (TPR) repeat protein
MSASGMTQLTIEQAYRLAIRHHQAGQLPQAENLYRQILAQHPQHADALHYLGLIAQQVGKNAIALDLIGRSISLRPEVPEAHNNIGIALRELGRLDEAIAAFRQAIARKSDFPQACNNLGNGLKDKGDLDGAVAAYRQAIAISPGYADAYSNLGNVLRDTRRLDEAVAACRQAIELQPGVAEYYCNLANALKDTGQLDDAIAAYRHSIALKPDFPNAYCNLGNALRDKGQLNESIAACRQAIALEPSFSLAHYNLANALRENGDEAIAAYRQAIALQPNYPEAHGNLGVALHDSGQFDEAVASYQRAISLKPDVPEVHYNLAHTQLLRGNFAIGWAEYEWRWKVEGFPSPRRHFAQPLWDGSEQTNRAVLLHAEQGFGDTIQFIRYAPVVAERCGKLVLACPPEMRRLLSGILSIAQCIVPGEALPPFDFHCPLMTLPLVFGTMLQTIPQTVPYLQVDAREIERWRERLASNRTGLSVGLAWAGRSSHTNDRNRSLPISFLAPLAQVPNVNFYSLQKGEAATQPKSLPNGMNLIDWSQDLSDFADTAALVANLDLVITVDTAVAHLAGAMGKPVWLLLPFVPDWRWMRDREDSPWYPTMRLFRQKAIKRWDEVIARVAACLAVCTIAESTE